MQGEPLVDKAGSRTGTSRLVMSPQLEDFCLRKLRESVDRGRGAGYGREEGEGGGTGGDASLQESWCVCCMVLSCCWSCLS